MANRQRKHNARQRQTDRPVGIAGLTPQIPSTGMPTWIKPKLVAEIEYQAWTHDGKLRHASYRGLRDADNAAVYEME
nr:hypothetical protein [Rhizobium ruizarguesonis]